MKTINVSQAEGPVLDWLVAKINGGTRKPKRCFDCRFYEERQGRDDPIQYCHHPKMDFEDGSGAFNTWPSDYETHSKCPIGDLTPTPVTTDWSQGGPIIEREGINLSIDYQDDALSNDMVQIGWKANLWNNSVPGTPGFLQWSYGPTPLIAVARCFVASKLGEVVEVPEELA